MSVPIFVSVHDINENRHIINISHIASVQYVKPHGRIQESCHINFTDGSNIEVTHKTYGEIISKIQTLGAYYEC
jgi:hypothetical protein